MKSQLKKRDEIVDRILEIISNSEVTFTEAETILKEATEELKNMVIKPVQK